MIKIPVNTKNVPDVDVWITSDTHFSHKNICRGTTNWRTQEGGIPISQTRDFSTIEKMNSTIVDNINENVGQDDILIHLGDWSFGGFERIEEFRNRIVCKNIHIITGNHDHHIENNKNGVQSLFASVSKYQNLVVKTNVGTLASAEHRFALMHFPLASWDNMARKAIHLHGHVHFGPDKRIGKGKMMDVGVDGNGLYPINMSEVVSLMKDQPVKSMFEFDHHELVENYK